MLQLAKIAVGAEVGVRFNAKRYHGTVTDLLEWATTEKKHKLSNVQKPTKERKMKENEKSATYPEYILISVDRENCNRILSLIVPLYSIHLQCHSILLFVLLTRNSKSHCG